MQGAASQYKWFRYVTYNKLLYLWMCIVFLNYSVIIYACYIQCIVFLPATKQLYEWSSLSVWRRQLKKIVFLYFLMMTSIHLSRLFHYAPIIIASWNFQELSPFTDMMSIQKVTVKVTEFKAQFNRFLTLTPGWIHIQQSNDAQSLMWHIRGALLFFKVICQISSSHSTHFWPTLGISGL